jgi:voltage-gated potassium channel
MRKTTATSSDIPANPAPAAATLRRVLPYLWPDGQAWVKRRVVLSLLLLILAKLLGFTTPYIYKLAVDALAAPDPAQMMMLGAIGLTVAYGLARLGAVLGNELRDAVFVRVGQRALRALALETLPNLQPWQVQALEYFEWFSLSVFSIEYLVRLWLTRPWHRYAFSFFGLIDLLSIAPALLALGSGSESLRALRLMRLFRLLKLGRYNAATLRFYRALSLAREELMLFGAMALILLYLAGVGMYQFEHAAQPETFASVFDGLWWALCTLTTVGYGDVYPVTVGGKLFTFFILVIGLGLIAVPVGLVSAALTQAREQIKAEAESSALSEAATSPGPSKGLGG